MPGLAK